MKIRQALGELFGGKSKRASPREEPRLVCHGCKSDQISMVLPASPDVLSYRCRTCGREWSSRAPVRQPEDGID